MGGLWAKEEVTQVNLFVGCLKDVLRESRRLGVAKNNALHKLTERELITLFHSPISLMNDKTMLLSVLLEILEASRSELEPLVEGPKIHDYESLAYNCVYLLKLLGL